MSVHSPEACLPGCSCGFSGTTADYAKPSRELSVPALGRELRSITVSSCDSTGERLIEARIGDQIVGSLRVQVIPLVKDMEVAKSFLALKIAESMLNYASGFVKASGFNEALVMVSPENAAMQRFVEARSIEEGPAKVYVMGVL